MTRVIAGCAVVLGLAVIAFGRDAAQVERGIQVYADQKCAVCHSVGDKGNTRGPLDDVGSRLSADEIEKWIVSPTEMTAKTGATRKPPMKAYPTLPAEDIEALVAYMLSLKAR